MDYRHYVTNDLPSGAWTLFGPDFMDYSGNGNHVLGYRAGTPTLSGSGGTSIPGTPASGTVLPPRGVRIIANDSAGSLRLGGNPTVNMAAGGNPSFEANTAGWGGTSVSLARYTSWSARGLASLAVTAAGTNATDNFAYYGVDNPADGVYHFGMVPGETYTVSAYANVPAAFSKTGEQARARGINIHCKLPTGSYLILDSPKVEPGTDGRVSITFTIPINAVNTFVRLYNGSAVAGNVIYWDALQVEKGSVATPYVEGPGGYGPDSGPSTITVPSTVMNPGREREAFSLEAWFKSEGVNVPTTILGRAGENDGLSFDGDAISFTTKYSLSGTCTATYYPKVEEQVFYVAGVHEPTRNLLYVNGTLVASTNVTEEQASDQYDPATVANALTAGSNGAGSVMIVDGLAVYPRALPAEVIANHYAEGTRIANPELTTMLFGGTVFDLVDVRASVARDFVFNLDYDWMLGVVDNAGIVNDTLIPSVGDNGLTEEGNWTYGDILTSIDTIAGSKIEWDADGPITVETSLDEGVTWLPASNGFGIQGIGTSYVAENTTLSIRVNFPAGVAQATRVNSLRARLYFNMELISSNGAQRLVPVGNVTIGSERSPAISRVETAGVKLGGGRAYITPSELLTQTVEGWFRVESLGTDPVTLLGGDASVRWTGTEWLTNSVEVYVDGALQPIPNLTPGRDYHLVFVLDSPTAIDIHLGANDTGTELASLQVSSLATFPSALSPEQISALYNTYLGVPSLPIIEDNSLILTDGATPPKMYSYAWSITSA